MGIKNKKILVTHIITGLNQGGAEKVLYDFTMFKSAREKSDFDFTGIQEIGINNSILRMGWIN